jgi:hypothetical protein
MVYLPSVAVLQQSGDICRRPPKENSLNTFEM